MKLSHMSDSSMATTFFLYYPNIIYFIQTVTAFCPRKNRRYLYFQ